MCLGTVRLCVGKLFYSCGFFVIEGAFAFDFIWFLISGGSFEGSTGWLSCFFIVAASGMPGIFSPGFIVRTAVFGLMPGVGVAPFGTFMTALAGGMPGVEFAEGGTGDVDISGGRSFALTLVAMFELCAVFAFDAGVEPQPMARSEIRIAKRKGTALNIYK